MGRNRERRCQRAVGCFDITVEREEVGQTVADANAHIRVVRERVNNREPFIGANDNE